MLINCHFIGLLLNGVIITKAMKRSAVLLAICSLFGLMFSFQRSFAQDTSPKVLVLEANSAVSAPLADYLERGLRYAEQQDYSLIVIKLNTPGGKCRYHQSHGTGYACQPYSDYCLCYATRCNGCQRRYDYHFSRSRRRHVTRNYDWGASPVGIQGEDMGETIQRKAKEMLKASVRSLAERRGEKAQQIAEDTIENAKALSADEALKSGLIDFIAEDIPALLDQLEGFKVKTAQEEITLRGFKGAKLQDFSLTFIEQALLLLTNPNIVFLLLTIGVQAILIELSSPGGWVAGFIGVVALMLALYGLGLLPVNLFGLFFILMAFVLFILELKMPTYGALTAAGIASLIIGALVLFNTVNMPGVPPISIPLVVATAIISGVSFAVLVGFALRAQKSPIKTGAESLIGLTGTARTALEPRDRFK
jgi:membrane-bound serine protease (ClpP class)